MKKLLKMLSITIDLWYWMLNDFEEKAIDNIPDKLPKYFNWYWDKDCERARKEMR